MREEVLPRRDAPQLRVPLLLDGGVSNASNTHSIPSLSMSQHETHTCTLRTFAELCMRCAVKSRLLLVSPLANDYYRAHSPCPRSSDIMLTSGVQSKPERTLEDGEHPVSSYAPPVLTDEWSDAGDGDEDRSCWASTGDHLGSGSTSDVDLDVSDLPAGVGSVGPNSISKCTLSKMADPGEK